MKLAGVQSRSSWKELAVSNVFSAALMAGFVKSLKYTTREIRPDNTSNNSFPSGHTATAFMCATILHKEYGMKSPWYSIGGYTLAGITGVTRQLNNRHWIGDVLVGAGIGMISTDLGYFFSDLIFRRDNADTWKTNTAYDRYDTPSFLSFNMGIASGPSVLRTAEIYDSEGGSPLGMRLKVGTATVVSVEGAYFFNAFIGAGGRLKVATLPVIADIPAENMRNFDMDSDLKEDAPVNYFFNAFIGAGGRLKVATLPVIADIPAENMRNFDMDSDLKEDAPVNLFLLDGLESDHLGMFDVDLGLYFSYPFSRHFQIGSKLLVGRRINANFKLNSICRINPQIFGRGIVSKEVYNQFYKEDIDYYMNQDGISRDELLNSSFVDDDFLNIRKSVTYKVGTGVSFTYRYKEDAALRLYCDYDFASPRLTYDLKNSWTNEEGNRNAHA